MPESERNVAFTKADLIESLFNTVGLNKREAKEFVEGFFAIITHHLAEQRSVKLSSFGNFIIRNKAERPGRNPKTGAPVPISARTVVVFRPGQKLKSQVERRVPKQDLG